MITIDGRFNDPHDPLVYMNGVKGHLMSYAHNTPPVGPFIAYNHYGGETTMTFRFDSVPPAIPPPKSSRYIYSTIKT